MDTSEFDRDAIYLPPRKNMALKLALAQYTELDKTSVEVGIPASSSKEIVGTSKSSAYSGMAGASKPSMYSEMVDTSKSSTYSKMVGTSKSSTYSWMVGTSRSSTYASSNSSHSTGKTHISGNSGYQGTDAWWNARDLVQPDLDAVSTNKPNDGDTWDLSDSIVDLYNKETNECEDNDVSVTRNVRVDVQQWIAEDANNGFVFIHKSDMDFHPKMFPCTLTTTAQRLCVDCGIHPNSMHVQLNGDIIRRLDSSECPLALQNEYLHNIGYTDHRKIQELGAMEDLSYLVKFYTGKPISDSTYSRNQLATFAYVRKGKLIYQWVQRLCVIMGTRLLIYRDKTRSGNPTIVQLAKGEVEEVENIKGHNHVLKLTSTIQGDKSVYLSFPDEKDYKKWLRKAKKATAKLPTKADLSNCHLEFLPETIFINEDLEILNLRHNVLKERPIEEDIYTIGWLDDLPRFINLRSLNLADNDLKCFPKAVCKIKMLTELNLASNKIKAIPASIVELENLQMLHIHNNCLNHLPDEMSLMRHLLCLVLAFNQFTTVPNVMLHSDDSLLKVDSLIMAGNKIEKITHDVMNKMQHIKKIDFRMNKLTFSRSEMAKFQLLQQVTHLDVRDNFITELDVRALRHLEYLNCERNKIHSLQVSGVAIKTLLLTQNEMSSFSISPKPEWLATLDVSHNKLETIPSWISDCFFLVQLNTSHNFVKQLPDKILSESLKLKVLNLSHNQLTELPSQVASSVLEEISLEHNQVTSLPKDFFLRLPKLRYFCVTHNQLETIPEPNHNVYQNKLQELYLSANWLDDSAIQKISLFPKLKILHLAYNQISVLHDRDLRKLENLQELNISGNFLRHLPKCLGRHAKLQALRCNANLLKELPDFRYSPNLKILEVSSNRLMDVSVTNLMASNVNLLDISGNPNLQVDMPQLKGIRTKKKVCMVDIKGQNRSLLDLRTTGCGDLDIPWKSGLSQTSGMRNKLSVSIVNRPKLIGGQEGLFAVFDGGRNDEVSRILANQIPALVEEELHHPITAHDFLKYTMLSAHRKLKATGQKLGAAGAVCYICKPVPGSNHYTLHTANVGDTEVVLCRRGEAVVLSNLFTVSQNKEEMERIHKSGGIVTEDNRINGVTPNTRLLGSSYLFPHVIPDPHISITPLQPDDQLIIIASQGLWKSISYQETVDEILDIPDPVLAAKKLQDLAQGYHSEENIGVLVVRLMLSNREIEKMKALLQKQFENEQKLLAELRAKDIEREEIKKKLDIELANDIVPMNIMKFKDARKRKQIDEVFNDNQSDIQETNDGVMLPLMSSNERQMHEDQTSTWELLLQNKLTQEVKDKELINAMRMQEYDSSVPGTQENWSINTKTKGQIKERVVPLHPNNDFRKETSTAYKSKTNQPPVLSPLPGKQINSQDLHLSTESLEFQRELKYPLNVDRDAVLFHNMKLNKHKSNSMSSRSLESVQSDTTYSSIKEVASKKTSSHSIEVLLNTSNEQLGGFHKIPRQERQEAQTNSNRSSCPTSMSDRLKVVEHKGFLSKEQSKKISKNKHKKIVMHEAGLVVVSGVNEDMNVESVDLDNDLEDGLPPSDYETITTLNFMPGRNDIEVNLDQEMIPIISKTSFVKNKNEKCELRDITVSSKHQTISLSDKDAENLEQSNELTELYATVHKVKRKCEDNNDSVIGDKHQVLFSENLQDTENTETKSSHNSDHTKHANNSFLQSIQQTHSTTQTTTSITDTIKSMAPPIPARNYEAMPLKDEHAKYNEIMTKLTHHAETQDHNKKHSTSESLKYHEEIKRPMKCVTDISIDEKPSLSSQQSHGSSAQDSIEIYKTEEKAPPIPPRVPLTTISDQSAQKPEDNLIRELDDLIAYNLKQQKWSYKAHLRAVPLPPSKLPDTIMVTKTASQRSIAITYL